MADNLDDLLDEVESKFCRNTSLSAPPSSIVKAKQDGARKQSKNTSVYRSCKNEDTEGIENDIEAVLQEILDEDGHTEGSDNVAAVKACAKGSCHHTPLMKCCPVFLGGSSVANGIGTSISQRACDQLRCTSCDFRVAMFDDHEWDSSCDYLFFRNNMPDYKKLRAKLKRRHGARAYACQCSWHSAFTLTELRHIQQLKWVCGQHKAC